MKETKAERIYRNTRYACRKHLETWGLDFNPNGKAVGFNNLDTDEVISTRTINAVEKELIKDKSNTSVAYKLNIISQEELNKRASVWLMIESTIENARKAIA